MRFSENKPINAEVFPLWAAIALLVAIGLILDKAVLTIRFQYDDIFIIVDNPFIREAHGLREYLFAGRPIRTITLFIDYALWGYGSRGFHLTNLILHLLCGLAWFRMLEGRFTDRWVAWWTALIFEVHPVVSETLAVVSHRKESLAFLFMVIALWSYLKSSRPEEASQTGQWPKLHVSFYTVSWISYLLGLGSKQVVIILPLLAFFADMFVSGRTPIDTLKRRGLCYLPYVAVSALLILVSAGDWRIFGAMPANEIFGAFHWRVLAISGWSVTAYMRILAWPILLSADHQIQTPHVWSVLLGVFLWLATLCGGYMLRLWNKAIAFGLIWVPLNLLMVLNLIPANQPLAERYLYIPLAGFCLFFVALVSELTKHESAWWTSFRWAGMAAVSAIILRSSLLILYHSELIWSALFVIFWVASIVLLGAMFSFASRKASFWRLALFGALAAIIITWFLTPLFVRLLESEWKMPIIFASERYDRFIYKLYHFKYGTPVSEFSGASEMVFRVVASIINCFVLGAMSSFIFLGAWTGGDRKRRDLFAVLGLVVLLLASLNIKRLREWATPKSIWEATLRTDPLSQRANVNLGVYWIKHKRPLKAEWYYNRAAAINPLNPTTWYDLAQLYLKTEDYEGAEFAFNQVITLSPNDVSAHLNLGNLYFISGRDQEAIEKYKKVLEIDPRNARAYYNTAVLLEKKGDLKDAYKHCRKALELRSDFIKAGEMCGPNGRLKMPTP